MKETKGRLKRSEKVTKLTDKVVGAKSIVFSDYRGLTANQISALRLQLRDAGADASVAKNTLMNISLGENATELKGQILSVFSYSDPIAAIKILFDFVQKNDDKPVVKGGIVEGKFTNANELETLSKLPSREQLIAQVVGGLKAPLTGIVGVMGGVQRSFVQVLSQIAGKKEN